MSFIKISYGRELFNGLAVTLKYIDKKFLDLAARHSEADPLCVFNLRRVQANPRAGEGDERAAGRAGINGGIGLDITHVSAIGILFFKMWLFARFGKDRRKLNEAFGLEYGEPAEVSLLARPVPASLWASLVVLAKT